MVTLKDVSVAVTGGATGIGFSIAKAMLQAGANVAIGSRRINVVNEAVEELSQFGPAIGHELDVGDRASVNQFFEHVATKMSPIKILVQAAGINIVKRTMQEMDPVDWDKVMAVNATGPYNCFKAVLPGMLKAKDGLVINISSIAGKRAISLGGIAYCASKFAMTAMGTATGNELAEHGIRVTNIYPGEVNTPILKNRPVPVTDEHKARILQPDDVAGLIVAIASLPPQAHVPEMVIKPLSQNYC